MDTYEQYADMIRKICLKNSYMCTGYIPDEVVKQRYEEYKKLWNSEYVPDATIKQEYDEYLKLWNLTDSVSKKEREIWCVTEEEGNVPSRQFYFYRRELAVKKQEELLLAELNSWIHHSQDNIIMGEINIPAIESLINSFFKLDEESNLCYDVTLSKIYVQDE